MREADGGTVTVRRKYTVYYKGRIYMVKYILDISSEKGGSNGNIPVRVRVRPGPVGIYLLVFKPLRFQ